jgi:hypothetical protein
MILLIFFISSTTFRNDEEFLLEIFKETPNRFICAATELRHDRNFILKAIKMNPDVYNEIHIDTIKHDREIIFAYYKQWDLCKERIIRLCTIHFSFK